MSSLTGFMQFVAADEKNIQALVNTFFFSGYRTGWAFDLLIWTSKTLCVCVCVYLCVCVYIYISLPECGRCALNVNSIIVCMHGLTLWQGREGLVLTLGSRCKTLARGNMKSFGPHSNTSRHSAIPKPNCCTEGRMMPSSAGYVQTGYGAAV